MSEFTSLVDTKNRASDYDTAYGADHLASAQATLSLKSGWQRLPIGAPAARRRKAAIGWIVIAACCGWIVGLFATQMAPQTLPWCISLSLSALFTLRWLYYRKRTTALYQFKLGELRPLVISESMALSFIACSIAIVVFIVVNKIIPHQPQLITRQVVDIEFVSNADAVDRNDILPGTEKKADQQKKVTSNAVQTEQGKTLAQTAGTNQQKEAAESQKNVDADAKALKQSQSTNKSPSKTVQPETPNKPDTKPTPPKLTQSAARPPTTITTKTVADAPQQQQFFVQTGAAPQRINDLTKTAFKPPTSSTWLTTNVAPMRTRSAMKTRGQAAFEEVAPPEMVEVTDTEGENRAAELWQSGGRSSGGKGAKSSLAFYLKELHRRIKRAWKPPSGETHSAEILFRIKRTGQVASIKLAKPSGNPEMDDAAMVAIAGCAPFKGLPSDYPADYLDLLYTFNYTVDSLTESAQH